MPGTLVLCQCNVHTQDRFDPFSLACQGEFNGARQPVMVGERNSGLARFCRRRGQLAGLWDSSQE